jgi:hypothetical protein
MLPDINAVNAESLPSVNGCPDAIACSCCCRLLGGGAFTSAH